MPPEVWEIIKPIFSALLGSGLTLAVVGKFGQSWLLKKIDANYAVKLAEKNSELMGQLERKKNELNRELQIEVTQFKSQMEVLGSQQSKFLEKKINSILLLNQNHYLAIKKIKELTDTTHVWVEEAKDYFKFQIQEKEHEKLSNYDVYRKIKEERWPAYQKVASLAFDKYAECLALNMPILPKDLVEEEMKIVDGCRMVLYNTSICFSRAMAFTQYIVEPEECEGTEEEFLGDLIDEHNKSIKQKEYIDKLSDALFDKSLRSSALIESLLTHQKNG